MRKGLASGPDAGSSAPDEAAAAAAGGACGDEDVGVDDEEEEDAERTSFDLGRLRLFFLPAEPQKTENRCH